MTTLMLLISATAQAAEFGTAVGPTTGRAYITYTGPVEFGDADKLKQTIMDNPGIQWLSLDSPGGVASEGYELASVISDAGLNVYVGYGTFCVSACYTAFLGGKNYEVKGVLAAHNAWTQQIPADTTVNQVLVEGQRLGSYNVIHHLANGFNVSLPFAISNYTDKDTFIAFTHEDQLNQFFARDEEDNIVGYLVNAGVDEAWVKKHVTDDLASLALERWMIDYPEEGKRR